MIGGDLERQIPISSAGDELDAICYSVNILVGELAFATANLRRAQAEAEAANAAKSTFLRTASHELRTPLAVIVWLAELLQRSDARAARAVRPLAGGHPPQRRGAAAHHGGGPRSVASRRARTTSRTRGRSTSPGRSAKRWRTCSRSPNGSRSVCGLTIEPGAPATMMTNGQHVRQVVMNLVANAIKFTLQGEVVVRVQRATASLAAIDVEDTGIGIPEASQARIFEPFFQVNRSAAQRLGGSGVGLALAKRFAEGLGGDCRCSRPRRRRLDLSVHAPARPRRRSSSRSPRTRRSTTPVLPVRVRPLEGLRVLVADDEELVLDALCKLLETAGATVGRATDGEQAMEKALEQDFALILMDVRMPVLDGLGATSRLRAAGFWRPIVALTASATADQRAACLAAGCNDHLTKPIAAAELVSKVAAVCRRLDLGSTARPRTRSTASGAGGRTARRRRAWAPRRSGGRRPGARRRTGPGRPPSRSGVAHHLGQPAHALGRAAPHRDAEDLLAQLGHARELRGAAGDHGARGEQVLAAEADDLGLHEREHLLDARLDDVAAQGVAGQHARRAPADRGDLQGLVLRDHRATARSRSGS